jgi:hypothetical protein
MKHVIDLKPLLIYLDLGKRFEHKKHEIETEVGYQFHYIQKLLFEENKVATLTIIEEISHKLYLPKYLDNYDLSVINYELLYSNIFRIPYCHPRHLKANHSKKLITLTLLHHITNLSFESHTRDILLRNELNIFFLLCKDSTQFINTTLNNEIFKFAITLGQNKHDFLRSVAVNAFTEHKHIVEGLNPRFATERLFSDVGKYLEKSWEYWVHKSTDNYTVVRKKFKKDMQEETQEKKYSGYETCIYTQGFMEGPEFILSGHNEKPLCQITRLLHERGDYGEFVISHLSQNERKNKQKKMGSKQFLHCIQ